jgi:hypothetical protein
MIKEPGELLRKGLRWETGFRGVERDEKGGELQRQEQFAKGIAKGKLLDGERLAPGGKTGKVATCAAQQRKTKLKNTKTALSIA